MVSESVFPEDVDVTVVRAGEQVFIVETSHRVDESVVEGDGSVCHQVVGERFIVVPFLVQDAEPFARRIPLDASNGIDVQVQVHDPEG